MTRSTFITTLALCTALLLLLLSGIDTAVTHAAPPHQACEGQVITGGCFFSQTTNGQGGYAVTDDNQAHFWSEYQRLGGAQTVGYPISRRFVYDGFVTQAFQKLVLQWRPEVEMAYPMNVFDELSEAGHDARLFSTRQTPYPAENLDPPNATWAQIVAARQGLLNANAAIRSRYFSFSDPLNVFGLPTSRVEDMGNHYAIRTQRAVFQQWKEAVPWAGAGQVTIANGGDIAKEMGWFNPDWLLPQQISGTPIPVPTTTPAPLWEPQTLVVSAYQRDTYFLLQAKFTANGTEQRLMVTRNGGASWEPFITGTLPTTCNMGMTIDPNSANDIYLMGCDGLYHWNGGEWVREEALPYSGLAIQRGDARIRWAGRDTATSNSEISRSDDGGRTWQAWGFSDLGARHIVIDGSTNRTIYAIDSRRDSVGGSQIIRLDGTTPNRQVALPVGNEPADYYLRPAGIAVNSANGDVYVARTGNNNVGAPSRIWRSLNADTPDAEEIVWEVQFEASAGRNISFFTGVNDTNGRFTLYMTRGNNPASESKYSVWYSEDEGKTWQEIPTPQ